MTELDLHEFRDAGYLAEVNRRFLHPLGLALAMEVDPTGARLIVVDDRDDPAGVSFADPAHLADKAAKVRAEEKQRLSARVGLLGYWVQPIPGQDWDE